MVPVLRLVAVAVAVLALGPAPARAAGTWQCEAGALTGSVLGQPLPAVVANAGAPECRTDDASIGAGLPDVLEADAIVASTRAGERDALAVGGVANLRVRSLPTLPIALPDVPIPDEFGAVVVPLDLSVLDPLDLLGLPTQITIDIRPAVEALLPDRQLPTADLVSVQAAIAYAAGACTNGRPALAGAPHVAGVQILGKDVGVEATVEQTLTLIDTSSVDPSDVDLSLIALPPEAIATINLLPAAAALIDAAIASVLDTLPDVVIPPTLATVKLSPGGQTLAGTSLTQRALDAQVSIAGQSVADLALGRSTAGHTGVDCSVPAPPPTASPPAGEQEVADLALECTDRRLVLVDVVRRKGRVALIGAADKRLAGRVVGIVFHATKKRVASALIEPDGSFETTAPLPRRKLRRSNRARYRAVLGRERSLNLKLRRRMIVKSIATAGGVVTIKGRVVKPLAKPVASMEVRRRVSCKRWEVVDRVKPRRGGRFTVEVDAPEGLNAAVYRLATRVRKNRRNRKTFPTFTLPRGVNLLG